MTNALTSLREYTSVVADTGDASAIKQYQPTDCTTNPSLVLAALQDPQTEGLIMREIEDAKSNSKSAADVCDALTVAIGVQLSKQIPGYVSTEVDAYLSFDTDASVARARAIIAEYKMRGVDKNRILIKLAATWEGIRAAEILQNEGTNCNLTLVFNLSQAIACAEANAFLISPFVGRITDWYKKSEQRESYAINEDPGVISVKEIYNDYKSHNIQTIVMGASFRNIEQIKALAGCDRLTIAPQLLDQLENDDELLERALTSKVEKGDAREKLTEQAFRWNMNADAMATEKLAEGIRNFDKDHKKLIGIIYERMK